MSQELTQADLDLIQEEMSQDQAQPEQADQDQDQPEQSPEPELEASAPSTSQEEAAPSEPPPAPSRYQKLLEEERARLANQTAPVDSKVFESEPVQATPDTDLSRRLEMLEKELENQRNQQQYDNRMAAFKQDAVDDYKNFSAVSEWYGDNVDELHEDVIATAHYAWVKDKETLTPRQALERLEKKYSKRMSAKGGSKTPAKVPSRSTRDGGGTVKSESSAPERNDGMLGDAPFKGSSATEELRNLLDIF